jgi:TPR repeat protein
LAICYEKGLGVPKDEVQAYKWFSLAASQDDEHALDIKVSMAKLESRLTKEQVVQAQHLAHEFKASQENSATKPAVSAASSQSPGPTRNLFPSSPPAVETSKGGSVTVNASLEDCEVFIDGAFVGNSPAQLTLPEGQHTVEVKKPGFGDYRRELKVIAGSVLTLTPRLEKQ